MEIKLKIKIIKFRTKLFCYQINFLNPNPNPFNSQIKYNKEIQ